MSLLAELGSTVLRQIPPDMIAGVASGALDVCGGVIRNGQGQIVAHLVASSGSSLTSLVPGLDIISGVVGNVQLAQISSQLDAVLGVAQTGVILSGLGLAVSVAGFAFLNAKLNRLEQQVADGGKQIKIIAQRLETSQKARFISAKSFLQQSEVSSDPDLQRQLLFQCKNDFSLLTNEYALQWSQYTTPAEIELSNDIYLLSMLGNAMVSSNLGQHGPAANDLSAYATTWNHQARVHVKSLLFADGTSRLFETYPASILPTDTLIDLLDFANKSTQGIRWIDAIRSTPAREVSARDGLNAITNSITPDFIRGKASGPEPANDAVDLAKSMRAQADVLDAIVAHFNFLKDRKLSALEFHAAGEAALRDAGQDAILIDHAPASARIAA